MREKLRTLFIISTAVLIGAASGASGVYLLLVKPLIISSARVSYFAAIAEAKLTTVELELFRKGESDKLLSLLESRLNDNLNIAASLESLDPNLRDKQVDDSISYVQSYRSKYPSGIQSKK